MKTTLEKVFETLNKVELKSEKIELNLIDDLEKYESQLDKGRDELMQFATDAREAIAKGVRELNRLDSVNKVAKRILGDVKETAKELGVKVPQIKNLEQSIKVNLNNKENLLLKF
jgi:DNA integrity scanning protein DisA with diadenylate cyclase activity